MLRELSLIRLLRHALRLGQLRQLLKQLLQLHLRGRQQLVALRLVLLVQLGQREEANRD